MKRGGFREEAALFVRIAMMADGWYNGLDKLEFGEGSIWIILVEFVIYMTGI